MEPIILGSQNTVWIEIIRFLTTFVAIFGTAIITWRIATRRIGDEFRLHRNRILWDQKFELYLKLNDLRSNMLSIFWQKGHTKWQRELDETAFKSEILFHEAKVHRILKMAAMDALKPNTQKAVNMNRGANMINSSRKMKKVFILMANELGLTPS